MPTYEYACMECDLSIEKQKSFAEADSVEICEKCGNKMIKVFGTFFTKF